MKLLITNDEFRHRYRHTIVGMMDGRNLSPVKIEDYDSRGNIVLALFTTGENLVHSNISELDLDLSYPEMGMLNVGKGVRYNSRNGSSRVYKRGLVVDNISSFDPVTGRYYKITNSVVTRLYNPLHMSAGEAIKRVVSGRHDAAAFSAEYCIVQTKGYELPLIHKGKYAVGYYNDNKFHVPAYLDFVQWELSELSNVEVVNARVR